MKDGGPAFPMHMKTAADGTSYYDAVHDGMSLRDWFAGKTLQGMMADSTVQGAAPGDLVRYADYCYRMADAMLKEREKSE